MNAILPVPLAAGGRWLAPPGPWCERPGLATRPERSQGVRPTSFRDPHQLS